MGTLICSPPVVIDDLDQRLLRAERRAARERAARLQAEAIAERGLRELWASQQQLLLLQRITDGSNRTDDVRSALKLAIDELCEHMRWEFGNAYLRDGDQLIACDTWHAAPAQDLSPFVECSRRHRFAAGQGLPGRVLTDIRPHWIEDVTLDPNFPRAPGALACGLKAGCSFPVLIGEEVVAVLEFFTTQRLVSDRTLVNLMAQVGVQIGRVVERERAKRTLLHDALHDALTGLPNRSLFGDRFQTAFERARAREPGALAVMVIDLDGFKAVNDTLGHAAGDDLLVRSVRRMEAALRRVEADLAVGPSPFRATLARMGGDEFTVLLEEVSAGATSSVADALHASLQPDRYDLPHATASIGIAHGSAAYKDTDQMLRDADLAMYEAKAAGRNRTVTLSDTISQQIRERMALEQQLRDAIAGDQFELHYQPIVEVLAPDRAACAQGAPVRGFEALVRWRHPERGMIRPDQFIPLAEETGLILALGDWVLHKACTTMAAWRAALSGGGRTAGDLPYISVNVSPRQFLQTNFASRVAAVLAETGIDASAVRLEITENAAIRDAERTRQMIGQIRSWGVKTSLDDFGTGYSSLSHLQRLPFDVLKIDRSFIAGLGEEASAQGIIQAILDLARVMGMGVVAEGIEHQHQAELLQKLGCVHGQGFLYSHPLTESDAFGLLA